MKTNKHISRLMAWIFIVSLVPVFVSNSVDAAQITTRSLSLSDATPAKTGVTYSFVFTPTVQASAGVIAFKFCNEDPLQGTTCTTPTGMSTTSATGTVSGQASTTWTINATTQGQPYFAGAAASGTTATATTVTLNTITNPSLASGSTYYAKIWTCATTTICADSAALDYGGIAWATEAAITVTAKVQETLSFCVYVSGTCVAPSGTVDLGTLTTSQISAANSFMQIGTNAQNGAVVQYFGATLTSGSNTITAAGSTPFTMAAGTEKFGINSATTNSNFKTPAGAAYVANAAPSGSAPIAAVSTSPTDYTTVNSVSYVVSASAPLTTTPSSRSSQTIAFASNPVNQTTFVVNYAAAISSTTKPGVYTTSVQYVGTGAF